MSPRSIISSGIIGVLIEVGQLEIGISPETEGDGTVTAHRRVFICRIYQFKDMVCIGYDPVIFTPAVFRRIIVLLPVVKQIVIETHSETTGHNHIIPHERSEIVETFLSEIIILQIHIHILLHIIVNTGYGSREHFFGIGRSDFLTLPFGHIGRKVGIIDAGCGQACGNKCRNYDSYSFHCNHFH